MPTEVSSLPPCGLYRTADAIATVPGGRLVYFHNHGDPGPGLYLPSHWVGNEARWDTRGTLLGSTENARLLISLRPQGFYRVTTAFECCERRCQRFEPEQLVQLGYNGEAQPILFIPSVGGGVLSFPNQGTVIDPACCAQLAPLRVVRSPEPSAAHELDFVH